jgi:hypothetical protein
MKQVVDFGNITNLDTVLSPATPVKKRGLEYGF